MLRKKIIVGSRDSKLAVMQSELVMNEIKKANPELELELLTLKTTGDKILDKTLDKIGGKGLFVKELDQALMDGRIHIAVHSLKDMPMEENEDLPIAALPKRGDPRDVLVLPQNDINQNFLSNVGSSSSRRQLQLKNIYKDIIMSSVRGNIITRLAKLDRGEYSALILAAAGLKRAGLENRISKYFSVDEVIPSAGQGILSVQARRDLDCSFLNCLNDENTSFAAKAERSFVRTLNGGCSSPIAAHARIIGRELKLSGLYFNEETKEHSVDFIVGDVEKSERLGYDLALRMKGKLG